MTCGARSGARPRLLYLCQQNPWRLAGGGLIRNYWISRALAAHFDIDLVTADDEVAAPVDYAGRFHSIRSFGRPRGNGARVMRALAAARPGRSLLTSGTVSRVLRTHVANAARGAAYRGAIFDLNMIEALPPDVPRIYHAHNCESALLQRRAAVEKFPMGLGLAVDARRVGRIEANVVRDARLVIACSQDDVRDLAGSAPRARSSAVVVPNGVDVAGYARARAGEPGERVILVSGSFDWRPNQLGLAWFCAEVLPRVIAIAGRRHLTVRVAGRMSAGYAASLAVIPALSIARNPSDMNDELARATVVVAPVVASSGTRLRILEAWAARRPVVTTYEGALGLAYRNDDDMIVRDRHEPEAFARALWAVLDDPQRAWALAATAYERVLPFDWATVGAGLTEAVERALLTSA